ncbi:MAG TPA: hypothetical protein VN782_11410 [Usitatibacter sp.]|nr:hypothetical protein [Usitatibacter sp.]
MDEALVEHASAKDLVARIEGARSVDESCDARVKVLGEYVRHHVRAEENEIFPQVAGKRDELDELGQEMHARRAQLREEPGLNEAGEGEGRMPMRARRTESRPGARGAD